MLKIGERRQTGFGKGHETGFKLRIHDAQQHQISAHCPEGYWELPLPHMIIDVNAVT